MAGMVVNILVGIGAAAVVAGVIVSHFRKKKKGGHSCGGCSGCSGACDCTHTEGNQP